MNNEEIKNTIDRFNERQAKYEPVARILRERYGDIRWRQGQGAMDELISCILSQNTNDNNRDRAFVALKERYPKWQDVVDAPEEDVIEAIRPAGLANQKGPRIQQVLRTIREERGSYDIEFLRDMTTEEARSWLTTLNGVGPKTAAIVLCFAFDMPAFPVDTHVHRVGKRIGFLPEKVNAEKAHPIMEAIVPPEDYYQFHIHLIRHGRDTCKARTPLCDQCPLTAYCDYYQQSVVQREDSTA
jgi:endonuclease-3